MLVDLLQRLVHEFPDETTVLERREPFAASSWRGSFVDKANGNADEDVEWLLNHFDEFSRQDVLSIDNESGESNRRRVFLASLMWGYGTDARWFKRLFSNVAELLTDPSFDDRLARTDDCLASMDVENAYLEVSNMAGIGPAYFTKYLYFAGRKYKNNYPLILDARVVESLASLLGFRSVVELQDYAPANNALAYVRFVETMHQWATELGISAEVLEFVLWNDEYRRRIDDVVGEAERNAVADGNRSDVVEAVDVGRA